MDGRRLTALAEREAPAAPVPEQAAFAHIPAGPFIYGPEECYERQAQSRPLRPRQVLDLPEFWLAKRPVTNAEWRYFLEAANYAWAGRWYHVVRGWRGVFQRAYAPAPAYPEDHAGFPVVEVSQADALAYCAWLSAQLGRPCTLPTEEQWEKAARGDDGRPFPWGGEFKPGQANVLESDLKHTTPTASLPGDVSPCGAADMGGNVQEWTASSYAPPPDDLFVAGQDLRVARGGSFNDTAFGARVSYRRGYPAGYYFPFLGFRIVVADR